MFYRLRIIPYIYGRPLSHERQPFFLSINVLVLFSAGMFLKQEVRGYRVEAASFLYRERV